MTPETEELLRQLWRQAGSVHAEPESKECRATYDHFAHDDCPGTITREEYARKNPDFDDLAYLEFYHEVYIFDEGVYRIDKGEGGIAEIRSDTNLITHEDGRTQEIPWACVSVFTNVTVE